MTAEEFDNGIATVPIAPTLRLELAPVPDKFNAIGLKDGDRTEYRTIKPEEKEQCVHDLNDFVEKTSQVTATECDQKTVRRQY